MCVCSVAMEHSRQVREVASVLQAMANDAVTEKTALEALEAPLHVPISTATTLLRHFRWDMDKLLASFADDAVATCMEARVKLLTEHETMSKQDDFVCEICMEKFTSGHAISLMCQHPFDFDCWKGHLQAKLADGPSMFAIRVGLSSMAEYVSVCVCVCVCVINCVVRLCICDMPSSRLPRSCIRGYMAKGVQ